MADSDSEISELESFELESLVPIAVVRQLMKEALPENAKISRGSLETVQRCVFEFTSFVLDKASDKCQHERREAINGDDVLSVMTTTQGFKRFVEPLKMHLQKYREIQAEDGNDSGKSF